MIPTKMPTTSATPSTTPPIRKTGDFFFGAGSPASGTDSLWARCAGTGRNPAGSTARSVPFPAAEFPALGGSEPSPGYSWIFISSTTAASAAAVPGVMPNVPGPGTAA